MNELKEKNIKKLISSPSFLLILIGSILFLINLFLVQQPLLGTFGYEFSATNSLLIYFASGVLTIQLKKKGSFNLSTFLKNSVVLFFIPLVTTIIYSIITYFCSFWEGLKFYFVLVAPALIIGGAIGSLAFHFTSKLKIILFLILSILLALIPVYEIYSNPQIFFYSPLIGYFPGTIYDEALSVDLKLVIYRILNIIFFGSVFIYLHKTNIKRKIAFISILLSVSILFFFLKPFFGFSNTFDRTKNYLNKSLQTDHFIIHYQDISSDEINFIALQHEYYYQEIKRELNLTVSQKINSFLFKDSKQKKYLFGSQNADVAKPWLNQIYLTEDSWQKTLKHELLHIFSAEFGTGIFKLSNNFNPALIEGFAEALDNNYDDISLDDAIALAFHNDKRINVNYLYDGLNFFKSFSGLSYLYAGSFTRFLIDKYGNNKFFQLYASGNFQSVYGISLDSLSKDFNSYLNNLRPKLTESASEYYFGRQSIFTKVCPRYISNTLVDAWKQLNQGNTSKSKKMFEEILSKTPNYSAIYGLINIYIKNKSYLAGQNLINKYLGNLVGTPYYFNLLLILGDLKTYSNDFDSAKAIYDSLITFDANIQISNLAAIRNMLLNTSQIKDYFFGSDTLKYELIKSLNEKKYLYQSFTTLMSLSKAAKIDYQLFKRNFDKVIIPNDVISSYALFKLSEYMLQNYDYKNSMKFAALARRYKLNNPYLNSINDLYQKAEWMLDNQDKIINSLNIPEEK